MNVLRAIARRWPTIAGGLILLTGLWMFWGYTQNGRYQLHKTDGRGWWVLDTRTGNMRRPQMEDYHRPAPKPPEDPLLIDPGTFSKPK